MIICIVTRATFQIPYSRTTFGISTRKSIRSPQPPALHNEINRMGGSLVDNEWEFSSPNKTLVLVGKTGNGKQHSSKEGFASKNSSNAVTCTCESQMTVLPDGGIINIIDTPGLFDFSVQSEFVGREIVNCIGMANDGIHAVLLVLSALSRFSKEEHASIQSLQEFFGSKINDYMIVVYTGGDTLERDGVTLESYLGHNCPEPLMKILELCENRQVLFDNTTTDEKKRTEQVEELLTLVEKVAAKNGRKPFTKDMFVRKNGGLKLHGESEKYDELMEQLRKTNEVQHKHLTEMVDLKLKVTTLILEQQLAEEQAARLKLEEFAQEAQKKSEDEIRMLRENLEKAQREAEENRKHNEGGGCIIL